MDSLLLEDIATLQRSFRTGESTPTSVYEDTIERMQRVDPAINAMAEVAGESARIAATESDERWRRGEQLSELDGVPVTIKDSVNVAGMHWRHGSAANSDLPAATHDSPPVTRLREAGAVIIGKTTMPDFGMLAAGVSSLYGITRNPWNYSLSPGGSSSGAAASLASGVGYAAVGTDIAGSVRIPAGFCGLAAMKPTQGRIAHIPPSNMRSAGPMARNISDLRAMFNVLSQADPRDMLCLPTQEPLRSTVSVELKGVKVGVLESMGYGAEPDQAVVDVLHAAANALAAGGAEVESTRPAFSTDPYGPLDRVFQVRAWAELLGIPPQRRHQVEPHLVAWANGAKDIDAVSFQNDLAQVSSAAADLTARMLKYDVVLSPVFPRVGFPAESVGLNYDRPLADCGFTCWFNQTGQPAGTICFGFHDGIPVGVQVVASRFRDDLVFRVCEWLEGHRPVTINWPGPQAGNVTRRDI